MDIKNKVIIVTGASYGIGLATVRLLASKGARLVLAARSKERLEEISKELPDSLPIQADVSKTYEIKKMVRRAEDHFGRIDVLVNNAGRGYDAPVEKIDVDAFRHIFDLNVIGPLVAMQQVIPVMRKQGGGSIVNVSSGTALMYLEDMGAYSSTKRALGGISLTAREELKKDNIVVSVVYPYITLTDFEKNTIKGHIEDSGDFEGAGPFKPDTAEHVAEKIFEAIKTGEAEIYAREWMKKGAAGNRGEA